MMTIRSLKKLNTKLQFLYRQIEFLNPKLRRLLCNSLIMALIQLHFDYMYISLYPLVSQKIREKIQVTQKQMYSLVLLKTYRHHIRITVS